MRLPKLVPGAGASAANCPSSAHPLAGVLVLGAPLRHPKSVAGAVADAAAGPPYLSPQQPASRGPDAPTKACSWSWGQCS